MRTDSKWDWAATSSSWTKQAAPAPCQAHRGPETAPMQTNRLEYRSSSQWPQPGGRCASQAECPLGTALSKSTCKYSKNYGKILPSAKSELLGDIITNV